MHSLKPTFFLAILEEKKEINGHPVYILGHELARDLFTVPALSQDNGIFIPERIGQTVSLGPDLSCKKIGTRRPQLCVETFGLTLKDTKALHRNLEKILKSEIETYIYHELGEIEDTVFDRDIWREIIAAFPQTPIEHLVRAIKDFLADTKANGPLRFIIREQKNASLGLYVAFIDGLRKELFPNSSKPFRSSPIRETGVSLRMPFLRGTIMPTTMQKPL